MLDIVWNICLPSNTNSILFADSCLLRSCPLNPSLLTLICHNEGVLKCNVVDEKVSQQPRMELVDVLETSIFLCLFVMKKKKVLFKILNESVS